MKRLAVSLVALLLVLALAEAGFRLVGYEPVRDAGEERERFQLLRPSADPDVAYELVPGARGHFWGADVDVNAAGFRDAEIRRPKPAGTTRVLALGDSVTFGYDLPASETWPERLEALLADRGVEVVNLGVGGYDTLNEAAQLARSAADLEPDLVLVGYCLNDVSVASANLTHVRRLSRYASPWYRLRLLQFVGVRLDWRLLAEDMERINEEESFRAAYAGRLEDVAGDAELEERVQALGAHLEKRGQKAGGRWQRPYLDRFRLERLRYAFDWLGRVSRERGLRTIVVPLPAPVERDDSRGYALVWELVRHEVTRAGLGWVERDSLPPPDAIASREDGDPIHFDAAGHERLAEALVPALADALPAPTAKPPGGG